jgi:multiple sugar transport system ATP-binding protein
MVFQNYALYPHMTVADNMGFALKIAGVDKDEIAERVLEAAKILDLTTYLERKPKALSGGQRQRVAMGRAIVRSAQVFLMDEPLSNLDAKLRVQTRTQIASLQRRLGVTTVYVTHDQIEAMTMGDRVAVLKDGILQQCDSPRDCTTTPTTSSSPASSAPRHEPRSVPVTDGGRAVRQPPPSRRPLAARPPAPGHRRCRPEDVEVATDGDGPASSRSTSSRSSAPTPTSTAPRPGCADVTEGGGDDALAKPFIARVDGRNVPRAGSTVYVYPNPNHMHLFNKETGQRLND